MQDLSVGVTINYKYDKKLFRRYTSNSTEMLLTESQYADDAALLPTIRSGAMRAVTEYMKTSQDFGLSLSIPKNKMMAADRGRYVPKIVVPYILNTVALNTCEISHILDAQSKL